jgi:hypothetical protein
MTPNKIMVINTKGYFDNLWYTPLSAAKGISGLALQPQPV